MKRSKPKTLWKHEFQLGDIVQTNNGAKGYPSDTGVVTELCQNSNGPYVKISYGDDKDDCTHVYERVLELIYRRTPMDDAVEEYELAIAAQELMK